MSVKETFINRVWNFDCHFVMLKSQQSRSGINSKNTIFLPFSLSLFTHRCAEKIYLKQILICCYLTAGEFPICRTFYYLAIQGDLRISWHFLPTEMAFPSFDLTLSMNKRRKSKRICLILSLDVQVFLILEKLKRKF